MTTIDKAPNEASLNETGAAASMNEVCRVTLDLIAALPERPERLRVGISGIVLDIDWRPANAPAQVAVGPVVPPPHPPAVTVSPATLSASTPPAPSAAAEERLAVTSPTVGTFYSAPEPGAAPFVTEGDAVRPGQQVGIIEAMKLMLPITTERAGRVAEILVKDGQPVEFGEHLVLLTPAVG